MLNKTRLAAVLALQVVLAGGLYFSHWSASANKEPVALVAAGEGDTLEISDGKTTATLSKTGGHWQVGKLPANDTRVGALLDELGTLNVHFPVADSAASQERFEVADGKFQRHLILKQGDNTLADLYFGTSPGFRQTHVRKSGDSAVYSVTFNNASLAADNDGWLDKSPAQTPAIDANAAASAPVEAGNKP